MMCPCWRGFVYNATKTAHFETVHIKNFNFYRKATSSEANRYPVPSASVYTPILFHNCSAHLND